MIPPGWRTDLGLLRLAGYAEGTTLILLLFVAVPLKRLAGVPELVSIVGPIHGLTFVTYLVLVMNVVAGRSWPPLDIVRIVGAAIVPFGTFANDRLLARKHRESGQ